MLRDKDICAARRKSLSHALLKGVLRIDRCTSEEFSAACKRRVLQARPQTKLPEAYHSALRKRVPKGISATKLPGISHAAFTKRILHGISATKSPEAYHAALRKRVFLASIAMKPPVTSYAAFSRNACFKQALQRTAGTAEGSKSTDTSRGNFQRKTDEICYRQAFGSPFPPA